MIAGLEQFSVACLCMFSFIFFKDRLEFFWVSSDDYCNKSILYKILYYYISAGLVIRAKYYTGFKLAESAVIFCGLSYDIKTTKKEKDNKVEESNTHDFQKIENVRISYFEFSLDPNVKINYWNRSVHLWLKYQVYYRLINLPHKFFYKKYGTASFIVFIISALWHGFYPGYYIFFSQLYFFNQATRILDKKLNFFKRVEKSNFILRHFVNFVIVFNIGSLGYAFCVLDFGLSIKFYKTLYFIPNILLVIFYIYCVFVLKGNKKETKGENKENLNTQANEDIKNNKIKEN